MNVIEAHGVRKQYPGTLALKGLTLQFESGKVHALIGKNGSGKSTLVKILSRAIDPTQGKVFLNGEDVSSCTPAEAFRRGIATVYQELSLIQDLSVAENIFMGRLPKKGIRIDWELTYRRAEELIRSMNVEVSPRARIAELSVWQCQIVEILKAMSYHPKVLLLDEPTSSLAVAEARRLFDFIRELTKRDVIVIFISHRLHELWEVADTCTVLRDGELIGTVTMKDASYNDVLRMMFGEVELKVREGRKTVSDEVVLEVKGLTRGKKFHGIDLQLHKGEVLGIAGMLGSGRTELLRAIFGADRFDAGEIRIGGRKIRSPSPRMMKRAGVALAPEDRKKDGLNHIMSVNDNLTLSALERIAPRFLWIDRMRESSLVARQIVDLAIKVSDKNMPVSSLSGGNQQKVVVGKWLNAEPRVMFFDEPSRGIDVHAKQQIFQIIRQQADRGISSIMISSELEELLDVCDRILIMRNGALVGEHRSDELGAEELYLQCMGGTAT